MACRQYLLEYSSRLSNISRVRQSKVGESRIKKDVKAFLSFGSVKTRVCGLSLSIDSKTLRVVCNSSSVNRWPFNKEKKNPFYGLDQTFPNFSPVGSTRSNEVSLNVSPCRSIVNIVFFPGSLLAHGNRACLQTKLVQLLLKISDSLPLQAMKQLKAHKNSVEKLYSISR